MDSLPQKSFTGNITSFVPQSKTCSGCKVRKPLSDFVKNKSQKDGIHIYCKECVCKQNKERRKRKPDKRTDKNFRFIDGELTEKRCGQCKEWKHIAEFSPNGNGLRWLCRECDALRSREKRSTFPNYNRDLHLKRLYGLSLAEYTAMLESQGGVCKSCGNPESMVDVRTGTPRSLAVDHCHTTGTVRGLLCQGCNQALGSLREAPERARALVEYIEKVVLD